MVSIIIPVLNEAELLRVLLGRLTRETGEFEIVVADGGSTDATEDILSEFPNVRKTVTLPGRGLQMNAGARAARGEVLVFLHCDTYAPPGAIAELPALLSSQNADFGAFRIRFDPPVWLPRLLAVATRVPSPWCCFGDQAIFVRADFFFSTGGFPEIPLLEDVHWVRAAGKRGRMVRSRHAVVSSARRFEKIGTVRQSWRNLSILIRDLLGQDPAELARLYDKDYTDDLAPGVAPVRGGLSAGPPAPRA
ncbi:MAG: TIGR04283 family arsenosugar biosynthesis glycosyltransferase [Bryobacterales bacterium]